MSRPHVQIDAPNQVVDLRRHLDSMLPRFTAMPGVVGLTLNGGLARGYGDHLSEIDVTVFVTPQAFNNLKTGKPSVAQGITVLDGQFYDVKYVEIDAERERDWADVELWDASYAQILYDPQSLIQGLLADKLSAGTDPGAAEGLLMSCWWYNELAGEIWVQRGDALQGHHVFNQAVVSLVKALFAANSEYVPHAKWLLHMSRSLEWRPADWERRLGAAICTGDLTLNSLRARQITIRGLWEDIDTCIRDQFFPGLPVRVMQRTAYEGLKLLVDEESVTIEEWRERTGTDVPNTDPHHAVIIVSNGHVVLDREALLRIGPEDMYAWHYEVLQAARNRA
jgi:hypothetical protein